MKGPDPDCIKTGVSPFIEITVNRRIFPLINSLPLGVALKII
jgi:hypothetical protein